MCTVSLIKTICLNKVIIVRCYIFEIIADSYYIVSYTQDDVLYSSVSTEDW